jgi:hypothetical protein
MIIRIMLKKSGKDALAYSYISPLIGVTYTDY